ncbi:PAAR-like domain-containing protein [Rhizobium sp. R635]|uniref:PAAR-like domain-containing protein n=1 Tax=Rhizobium sp. R635 TaxID=1764275 RepID=UPI000B5349E1|nr:PAAR-like domain-containing protein [Rhizobium sp. R635]
MSLPSATDIRIGDPEYPSPWTTSRPLEALRDTDEARIVSLAPDVCLTPVGSSTVPIPYPIVDYCGHDRSFTPTVRFAGKKAMVMRSCTTHVHGDKPGVRKGVKSGTVESICEPIGHASQIRAEGSHVIRHLDRFWMNSRNTQGEALFVRSTATFAAPKDDDPVWGSLRYTQLAANDDPKTASDTAPPGAILGFVAPVGGIPALAGGGTATGGAVAGGATTTAGTAAGVGLGTALLGIGVFAVGVLFPTNKTNFSDFIPQDDHERQLVQDASQRIGRLPFWDGGQSIKQETLAQIYQRRQTQTQTQTQTQIGPRPQAVPLPATGNGRVSNPRCYLLPFYFTTPVRGTRAEMQRQLTLQQGVLNGKNPCTAAADIAQYPVNKPIGEAARPGERQRLLTIRANQIRALNPSLSPAQAMARAQQTAVRQDAIHTLDMVAGGQPTVFSGLGGRSENRSIGSQWGGGKAGILNDYATTQCRNGCPRMQTSLIAI